MIIETFFAGLRPQLSRADLEAEIKRLAGDYQTSICERQQLIREGFKQRAAYHDAAAKVIMLRAKLLNIRPYVLAVAQGSSLQARGDLAALDAVLRSTKP